MTESISIILSYASLSEAVLLIVRLGVPFQHAPLLWWKSINKQQVTILKFLLVADSLFREVAI